MATQAQTRYTYADLEGFPEDNLRREIIDGQLIVTAAPRPRHQRVVMRLAVILAGYADEHGGEAFPAPTDVFLADDNVVEPDLLYVSGPNRDRLEERFCTRRPRSSGRSLLSHHAPRVVRRSRQGSPAPVRGNRLPC